MRVTYTHIYIISYTYIILLGMRRRLHPEYGQVTALWIVESARRWRWTSVLCKCVTLGVAYFLMEAIVKVYTPRVPEDASIHA